MRKCVLLLLLLPALLLAAACTPDPAGESLPADTSSDAVSAPEKPCQTAQVYIDCPTDITKDAYVHCLLVRLNATLFFTFVKSFGTLTYAMIFTPSCNLVRVKYRLT